MNPVLNPTQILAFVVFSFYEQVAEELSRDASSERNFCVAAHLARALNVQAFDVLGGKSFDCAQALEAIAEVDKKFGTNFERRFWELLDIARRAAGGK